MTRAPYAAAVATVLALASAGATAAPLAPKAAPRPAGVHLSGTTALAKVVSPVVLIDRGTISGSPVGSGRITLVYRLHPLTGIASTAFTIVNARGRLSGRAFSRYVTTRLHITFTGVASITGGTRAYRGARGRPLEFDALHSLTGRREAVVLTGRVTLPR